MSSLLREIMYQRSSSRKASVSDVTSVVIFAAVKCTCPMAVRNASMNAKCWAFFSFDLFGLRKLLIVLLNLNG